MLFLLLYLPLSLLVIFAVGKSSLKLLKFEAEDLEPDLVAIIGLCSITLISSLFSLFIALDSKYSLILMLSSIPTLFHFKNKTNFRQDLNKPFLGLFLAFFIFLSLICCQEIWVADTAIHHAQAVQWIKNFAVVPGLANLQPQIGFNSSFFITNASLSLDFPQYDLLVYPVNGILLLVITFRHLNNLMTSVDNSKTVLNLTLLILLWIFLPKWANSLSPDMAVCIFTIYLFLLAYTDKSIDYRIPIIISACLVTFKLSTLFAVLFLLPHYIKSNSKKHFLNFTCLAFFVFTIPYLIRNYILSGFLVFPLYHIDLFNPEWKVPFDATKFEYEVIKSWARTGGKMHTKALDMQFLEWLPLWNEKRDLLDKVATALSSFIVIPFISSLFRKNKRTTILTSIVVLNLCFWLWGAPDPRFAYGTIFISIALFAHFLFLKKNFRFSGRTKLLLVSSIFLVSIGYNRKPIIKALNDNQSLILPKNYKYQAYDIIVTNFKYKKGRCKNIAIPCTSRTTTGFDNILLRDSSDMSKGFRAVN